MTMSARGPLATPSWGVCFTVLLLMLSLPEFCIGQNGDRQGEIQEENWRQWEVPEAPVLTAEEAIKSFQLAPGFTIELVASEPEVVDPVAMAWDEKGRLWVVEMRSYMPNVDGDGEMEAVGQIVVLEDHDKNGHYETSHVFLDRLINPRAISIVEGGVLVGEPPNLWYCQDLDGDFRCDRRTSLTHYGTENPDHVEHTDNGLVHNLDNWIYNSKSSRKFRFNLVAGKPQLIAATTSFRGQWGICQDDFGRLYYNHNSTWILADPLPTEQLLTNPWCGRAIGQPARAGQTVVADQSTYPIRINPGINRGYQKPMLRNDGRLRRNTAASGVAILRSDRWGPDWNGRAFVPEAAGNLVAAFDLQEASEGLQGQQLLWPHPKYGQQAFLASTDERFRPVDVKVGPDGHLYIIDMYRGIIQHRQFVTSYLRKQIEERGLAEPVGLGRIWRIVPENAPKNFAPSKSGLQLLKDTEGQVEALSHPVGWIRDTAQRLLVESAAPQTASLLKPILANEDDSLLARIHALRTLEGLGQLQPEDLCHILSSPKLPLRRIGCQILAEQTEPSTNWQACISVLTSQIDERRSESLLDMVNRLLALSAMKESEPALEGVFAILQQHAKSPLIRLTALSQWDDYQVERLSRFLSDRFVDANFSGFTALLNELTRSALFKDKNSLSLILDMIGELESTDARFSAVIAGIDFTFQQKRWQPPALSVIPQTLTREDLPEPLAAACKGIISKILVSDSTQESVRPWTEEERRWAKSGANAFASACSSCHGAGGQGLPGLGPSLLGSEWLLGAEDIPIRIILDGLTGPITVDGELWNQTMPGHRENPKMTDSEISALLTWIRRQWGHRADPVSPETVTKIRSETVHRKHPWTDALLREGSQ
ncbi:MAG: hypothetical protein CBC13_01390 [Planctomycetia bacterium TMED53]|nr:MAG: hypothetical protein CBC13_01390 [Planctomycetia bacterium TMED53]